MSLLWVKPTGRGGCAGLVHARLAVDVLAQQEFAPGLDHRLAVIGDDVGRRVGLAP